MSEVRSVWYDTNIKETSPEFEDWWERFYGAVDQYLDPEEYWIRKAFAWYGWEAAKKAK